MTPAPLPAPAKGQRWRDRKVGSVVTIRDVLTMRVVVVDERAKERSIRKWTLAQRYSPVPPLSVGMWVRLVPGRGLRRDRELGLLRPDWTGKVVNLTEKDGRLFAVCFHEPEDCGCHLAPRAAHRGLGSLPGCPRCHGTGIALNRSLPVEDIEEVPHAHQVPEYS